MSSGTRTFRICTPYKIQTCGLVMLLGVAGLLSGVHISSYHCFHCDHDRFCRPSFDWAVLLLVAYFAAGLTFSPLSGSRGRHGDLSIHISRSFARMGGVEASLISFQAVLHLPQCESTWALPHINVHSSSIVRRDQAHSSSDHMLFRVVVILDVGTLGEGFCRVVTRTNLNLHESYRELRFIHGVLGTKLPK
jgi:hypothetical protein